MKLLKKIILALILIVFIPSIFAVSTDQFIENLKKILIDIIQNPKDADTSGLRALLDIYNVDYKPNIGSATFTISNPAAAAQFIESSISLNLLNTSIENQNAITAYNGHPSHYLYWPFAVDQEIWYINSKTGEKVEQIINPNLEGETDFKLIRCQNDGSYTGCAPITIGNRGTCADGVVKDYGQLEAGWVYYYDNNLRDCDTGNPYLIYTRDPWDHTNGLKTRVQFQHVGMSGYGKYRLCVKYTHNTGLSNEKCFELISEWIDSNAFSIPSKYKYGSTLTYALPNLRTKYDQQPLIANHVEKDCTLEPWYSSGSTQYWWHDPRNDNAASVVLRKSRTWNNYWAYFGVYFGISNAQLAGDKAITATLKMPNSCYLRDRDGTDNYAFYHHNCGWYNYIDGKDKTIYCCGASWTGTDSGNCDKFIVSGKDGGTITITGHIDAKGDNFDDMRLYAECPGGTAFGNTADPYTLTVNGANYFWVNDMDYSSDIISSNIVFSEPLPDEDFIADTGDFTCNLKLNFCGKARVYNEFYNNYDVYGNVYTTNICVDGPECPHITC